MAQPGRTQSFKSKLGPPYDENAPVKSVNYTGHVVSNLEQLSNLAHNIRKKPTLLTFHVPIGKPMVYGAKGKLS